MYRPSLEVLNAVQDPFLALLTIVVAVAILLSIVNVLSKKVFPVVDHRDDDFENTTSEDATELPLDPGFSKECKNKCKKTCKKHIAENGEFDKHD